MKRILFTLMLLMGIVYGQQSNKIFDGSKYTPLNMRDLETIQTPLPLFGQKNTTDEYIYEMAPCPDGIVGCYVLHLQRVKNPNYNDLKATKVQTPAITVGEGLKLDTLADGSVKIGIADGYRLMRFYHVVPDNSKNPNP